MNPLLERLLANDLAALQGLQITGTVPLTDDLLNDVLQTLLAGDSAPASTVTETPATPRTAGSGSSSQLLRKLRPLLTRAQVKAHEGEVRIEFEIRR